MGLKKPQGTFEPTRCTGGGKEDRRERMVIENDRDNGGSRMVGRSGERL